MSFIEQKLPVTAAASSSDCLQLPLSKLSEVVSSKAHGLSTILSRQPIWHTDAAIHLY